MVKWIVALLLAATTGVALAEDVTFDTGTLSMGDSVEKMIKLAGKPKSVEPFPGMPDFTVYEFESKDWNIRFTVKDGTIVGIGVGRRSSGSVR